MLDRWFDAFNAHDVDACCAIADPAVEVIPLYGLSAPPGTRYHGHEGLRTLLTTGFRRYPRMRLSHSRPQAVGNRVTANLEFLLDDGVAPPKVKTVTCDYRISGGRIRRIRAFERDRHGFGPPVRERSSLLSPRERQVLTLLAGGQTVQEIADDLGLSPLTVRTHLRNAKDKLSARTTAHAIAIALDEDALNR